MSDKIKFPRAQALAIAEEIRATLDPICARIEIAGSLRRQRPEVGDIELVYIPTFEERQADFFTTAPHNLTDDAINALLSTGILAQRRSITGDLSWGEKNRLARHVASGIPVDLFATTEASWYNYLVCRTGPSESNIAIATAAQRKGWMWRPYSAGFYRIGHIEPMPSERAVFEFVGLPYLAPEKR